MQNSHTLSIILKHDFLTSCNFTSFFQTDVAPGNYFRKEFYYIFVSSTKFHLQIQSFIYIAVISIINSRGEGMAASQTDTHTWVLPLWRRRPSGGHPVREHRVHRGGCLRVLLHQVERLLLKQLPPGKLGDKHACAFELFLC